MRLSEKEKLLINRYFAEKPVIRAYLFGSMAREEANQDSDIDILVELDHSNSIGMKFFTYQPDLEELLDKKVDLISANGISPYIKPMIDEDKILIYEREKDR